MAESSSKIGPVLVVGGAGFVGYHITKYFQEQGKCTSVAVLSRDPHQDRIPGVAYHTGDILQPIPLQKTIAEISPEIIIHAACTPSTSSHTKTHYDTIVGGTRTLLNISRALPSIMIFIYVSSTTIAAGPAHVNLDETAPSIAPDDVWAHPYERYKAIADKMVLEANKPSPTPNDKTLLLTACLRLPLVYGERDPLSIPGCLKALEKRQTGVIFGQGINQWSFLSVENAAYAHLLLALALHNRLLHPSDPSAPKIDGEAFNITDGERHTFWSYPHTIWEVAGWERPQGYKPLRLPPRLLFVIAGAIEMLYWIFSAGRHLPTSFTRQEIAFACFEHTYRIEKAERRLGYCPKADFEGGVERAVRWCLERDGWGKRLGRGKGQVRVKKLA